MKRGDGPACVYHRSANGTRDEHPGRSYTEARFQHLEQLVHELSSASEKSLDFGSRGGASDTAGSNVSQGTPSGGLTYNGQTHWSQMLVGISQLRDALNQEAIPEDINVDTVNSYDIIFGATPALSYDEVLAHHLPSRQEADRLVAVYFRSKTIRAPCLHTAQFNRLYQKFWDAPHAASPLWTSMLFSICHVTQNVLVPQNCLPASPYSYAAAHCLVAGGYHRPRRFAVEALLLYLQVECIGSLDIPEDIGTLLSLVVRLATRMGYHKEPADSRRTPFEQEMRRRTWSLAMQLDLLLSFQAGLPSTVQFPTWNTLPPANIMDSDFDEDNKAMPPSRPDTEATDILFYIAKHKLMAVFEKILRHALGPLDEQGSTVTALDEELRSTYCALPEVLRRRAMADSILDPPSAVVARLCVFAIYAKSLCVLHRPYALKGHAASVRGCYEAASDLLQYYSDAYATMQPGGHNESERWFLGSITWNDFLTASSVLCLVVCVASQSGEDFGIDLEQTMSLLRKARSICAEQAHGIKDTRRGVRLLDHIVARFGTPASRMEMPEAQNNPASTNQASISVPTSLTKSSAVPSSHNDGAFEDTWMFDETQSGLIDDPSWTFMEEFLQLPDSAFWT